MNESCPTRAGGGITDEAVEELRGLTNMMTLNIRCALQNLKKMRKKISLRYMRKKY